MEQSTGEDARKDGALRVVLTFLTLVAFVAALYWIGRGFFLAPVDGAAKQREYFGERAPPFELALASATRLPTGDVLVRFAGPTGDAPGPEEVYFIEYESHAAVEPLFRPTLAEMGPEGDVGARLKEWERERAFEWHTTMKRDEIAWGEWSTKLLIERRFPQGAGWQDQARVDLSSPERALVLYAHWPAEEPADVNALREILHAVVLAPGA